MHFKLTMTMEETFDKLYSLILFNIKKKHEILLFSSKKKKGEIQEINITFLKSANKYHKYCQNIILDNIVIKKNRNHTNCTLTINVNSYEKAQFIKNIILKLLKDQIILKAIKTEK